MVVITRRNPYSAFVTRTRAGTSTPQSQPIPGTNQVKNSAGGYVNSIDQWKQLERFLILGTEGGTYYASESKLTVENAQNVKKCIEKDGLRVINTVVAISGAGRAPKADPSLFVLAMCISFGDALTKRAAVTALPRVARIGTHLFNFVEYATNMRGWGRVLRDAVGNWYLRHGTVATPYEDSDT